MTPLQCNGYMRLTGPLLWPVCHPGLSRGQTTRYDLSLPSHLSPFPLQLPTTYPLTHNDNALDIDQRHLPAKTQLGTAT